jgi:hypothetical protein
LEEFTTKTEEDSPQRHAEKTEEFVSADFADKHRFEDKNRV